MANEFGTLASLGMGSGIDIQGLVGKLVEREGKYTAEKLNKRELETTAKISGYGVLKGALSKFQDALYKLKDPTKLQTRTATVSNDPTVDTNASYFTATANSTAINGTHTIEVEQLARHHKFISTPYTSEDMHFSTGILQVTVGYEQASPQVFSIPIGAKENTLAGIKDTINKQTATIGIAATIITSDAGSQLVIASNNPGVKNTIHIEVSADNFETSPTLMNLVDDLTEAITPCDALVKIEGQEVTVSSNNLVNTIDGINIKLLKAEPGKIHTLTVNSDVEAATKYIEDFVAQYNELMEEIKTLTKANVSEADKTKPANSKEQDPSTTNKGDLYNESLVRQMVTALHNDLLTTMVASSEFSRLQNIGIKTDRITGKLVINKHELDYALNKNPNVVGTLFTDPDNGVAVNLYDTVNSYMNSATVNGVSVTSPLNLKEQELKKSLKAIDKAKLEHQRKMALFENRLLKQFANMDVMLGKLNAIQGELAKKLGTAVPESRK